MTKKIDNPEFEKHLQVLNIYYEDHQCECPYCPRPFGYFDITGKEYSLIEIAGLAVKKYRLGTNHNGAFGWVAGANGEHHDEWEIAVIKAVEALPKDG